MLLMHWSKKPEQYNKAGLLASQRWHTLWHVTIFSGSNEF